MKMCDFIKKYSLLGLVDVLLEILWLDPNSRLLR